MYTLPQPDTGLDISILVTCYNEAAYIEQTLDTLLGALEESGRSFEVVIIDDVSQDDSVERIRRYQAQHPGYPLTLWVNAENRGLANNYVEGAFLCQGKYYRLCCGDNCQPREAWVRILKQVGEADIIIPYQNQRNNPGRSGFRRLTSRAFTFLVNLISGYRIHYYNGLPVHLRYNVMRWHPSTYGFGFQADILTRLLDEGATYLQVFTQGDRERKGDRSTALRVRNLLSIAHTLLEIGIRRVRRILYGREMPPAREIFPREAGE